MGGQDSDGAMWQYFTIQSTDADPDMAQFQ